MVAVQFQGMNTEAHEIKLQDFIKGNFVGTTDSNNNPELQVWDTAANGGMGSYDIYSFYSKSLGGSAAHENYWGVGRAKDEEIDTYMIKVGQSAWFRWKNDCTITVAGQVVAVTDKGVETVSGNVWNMIANPFPTALKLNKDVNWYEAGLRGTTDSSNNAEIQVWNAAANGGKGSYDIYSFYSKSLGGSAAHENYWGVGRAKDEDIDSIIVPVGCGFWLRYKDSNSATGKGLTFTFSR